MTRPSATQIGFWRENPVSEQPIGDQRDVVRRRQRRASTRDVQIPEAADPARCSACERDLERFLLTYFAEAVYLPFSPDHREMILDIQDVVLNGDKSAHAAPRGDGKTTRSLRAILWAICYGHRKFPFLLCDTYGNALRNLKSLRRIIETNALLYDDFPELCACPRALRGVYNRAAGMTVAGEPVHMQWGGGMDNMLVFPTIPGYPNTGAAISFCGMDGGLRGLSHTRPDGTVQRPDLLLADDPQERKHAKNPNIVQARLDILKGDVLGMAGPEAALPAIYIGTIIVKHDMTDQILDRKLNPSWRGRIHKMMRSMPTNKELWDRYEDIFSEALERDGHFGAATTFYRRNQEAMDAGADPTWAERFDPEKEVSAVQHAMNIIYDRGNHGIEYFLAECQNEPPEPEEDQLLILDSYTVERSDSGFLRGVVPDNALALTAGWDIGKYGIHWTVAAIAPGRVVSVVDYGVQGIDAPTGRIAPDDTRKLRALELAVMGGLQRLRDKFEEEPYCRASGEVMPLSFALIDAGYMDSVVRAFCLDAGPTYRAVRGFGTARGQRVYYAPKHHKLSLDNHMHINPKDRPLLIYNAHADAYKQIVHAGFLLGPEQPGHVALFTGEHRKTHHTFARHVTAEVPMDVDGVVKWQPARGRLDNHWLDATCYAIACVSILEFTTPALGITGDAATPAPKPAKRRRRSITHVEI